MCGMRPVHVACTTVTSMLRGTLQLLRSHKACKFEILMTRRMNVNVVKFIS